MTRGRKRRENFHKGTRNKGKEKGKRGERTGKRQA
jgi:hypothetical protein